MSAYRTAEVRAPEASLLAEARAMARCTRLVHRKQFADALVGSPERDKFLAPSVTTVVGGGFGSWVTYMIWFHDVWTWALAFAAMLITMTIVFRLSARWFQRVTASALARAERDLAAFDST